MLDLEDLHPMLRFTSTRTPISRVTKYRKKWRWLLMPTQLYTHGQWLQVKLAINKCDYVSIHTDHASLYNDCISYNACSSVACEPYKGRKSSARQTSKDSVTHWSQLFAVLSRQASVHNLVHKPLCRSRSIRKENTWRRILDWRRRISSMLLDRVSDWKLQVHLRTNLEVLLLTTSGPPKIKYLQIFRPAKANKLEIFIKVGLWTYCFVHMFHIRWSIFHYLVCNPLESIPSEKC